MVSFRAVFFGPLCSESLSSKTGQCLPSYPLVGPKRPLYALHYSTLKHCNTEERLGNVHRYLRLHGMRSGEVLGKDLNPRPYPTLGVCPCFKEHGLELSLWPLTHSQQVDRQSWQEPT